MRIDICENGIYMVLETAENGEIRFLHFGRKPFDETLVPQEDRVGFRLAEAEIAGFDRPLERHGTRYSVTSAGCHMVYQEHRDYRNEAGRRLEITCCHPESGVYVTSFFQFYDGLAAVRTWTRIENRAEVRRGLSFLSIFNLNGIEKEGLQRDYGTGMLVHIPHNAWQKEVQWKTYTFSDLGLFRAQENITVRSSNLIRVSNAGNWSAKEHLPMGGITNTKENTHLLWQIEQNGSWYWEIGEQMNHLYLLLSGPTENEGHFFKWLNPGEAFESPTAALTLSNTAFEDAVDEMVRYRRRIRRPNEDNEKLSVIFNDYMNCLFGNPTEEKEYPMIDAAAEAGCEYYVIDAGWYDKGFWWDSVGEWMPSKERFPGGLKKVLDYIRSKGMIPGLWLEIEVMGIHSPKLAETDDSWFFKRHGERIYDRSRFQLDFRNPQVRAHATETVRRLVEDYGVGYIKMDYNIEPGVGTETAADSYGDGLLQHERAYLAWLDGIFAKYPELVIENCSSGGLRMDYALLSRHSIQSTSDQENYLFYASIAANAPSGVNPEQAAVWSYPLSDGDVEETIFNMANALLLRIHQSGHLVNLSEERRAVVHEAIRYYKNIRGNLKRAVPFWPLGFSKFEDEWVCFGLKAEPEKIENGGERTVYYLAVFRRDGDQDSMEITIPGLEAGAAFSVRQSFPQNYPCEWTWNVYDSSSLSSARRKEYGPREASGNLQHVLKVKLRPRTARIFEIVEECR